MDARTLSYLVMVSSLCLAVCMATMLLVYPGAALRLTVQQPFNAWPKVGDAIDVASYPNGTWLLASLAQAAWCDVPSVRPIASPWNRSDACACVGEVGRAFINETALSPFNDSAGVATTEQRWRYRSRVVACLRRRGTWKVWHASWIHPASTALFCSLTLAVLSTALALGQAGWGVGRWLAAALGVGGTVLFLIAGPLSNSLYAACTLATCVGVMYTLDLEFMAARPRSSMHSRQTTPRQIVRLVLGATEAQTPASAFAPPPPLMVCVYWYLMLATPALAGLLAATSLTRDTVAVLAFALLGYLAALASVRHFWAAWYMRTNATVNGWTATPIIGRTFGYYTRLGLEWGFYVQAAFIAFILVIGWQTGGNWSSIGSLLALIACMVSLGIGLYKNPPEVAMALRDGERAQVWLVLAANAIISVTAAVDSATG